MDKEVDIEEIKRTLKDANMYDSTLTSDELKSYYLVLKNSENTANEEEETRKLNKTCERESPCVMKDTDYKNDIQQEKNTLAKEKKPFVPKSWSSLKNKITESKQTHNEIIDAIEDTTKAKDATKAIFGFNDMEIIEKNVFSFIKNDLKFIPIQCTLKFLKADLKSKAKIMYSYHSKLHSVQAHLARQSFFPAPIPKAIVNMNQFSIPTENSDVSETYVSRSGRQTKRKIYNYDENSLDDDFQSVSKKIRNEELEWVDKTVIKKKSSDKLASSSSEISEVEKRITEKTLENNLEMDIVSEEEKVDVTEKAKSEVAKTETASKSTPKSNASKKLSNSDIMKRSKLFRDHPKKGPRSELLFDKLVEETDKKQKEEKAMTDFEKTLEQIDVDEEDAMTGNENEDIIVVETEEPKKRRVIPPIPGRKPINKRGNTTGLTPLSVVIETLPTKTKGKSNSKSNEETLAFSPTNRRNVVNKKNNNRPASPKKNAASTSQNNLQQCPICDISFSKDKIQEHAATCGDETEVVTRSTSKISKITCEICDAVIPLSTAYEVHVKDCISAKLSSENK